MENLTPDQLGKVIALELQQEDKRPPEPLYKFDEFQDVSEYDCRGRLFYLMNQTVVFREGVRQYHDEILGVVGLYMRLLESVPDENTWQWVVITSQERLLQKVHLYWAKVEALALDQHVCLPSAIRDVLLDGAIAWKNLHSDLTIRMWDGFAFGVQEAPKPGGIRATRNPQEQLMTSQLWAGSLRDWCEKFAISLYHGLERLESVSPEGGPARVYHQDEHGSFVTYEFLRRRVFGQWAIDKGLLRGLLRYVLKPGTGNTEPVTVADFGAGGGHYSTWMNETGLLKAFAFDGTHQAAELTGGVVQEINLVEDLQLWRTFDWVLCLEVGEHIPRQYSQGLLRNLKRHAVNGLVMSWSDDWEGIGHVACLPREEFIAFVQNETGFVFDHDATEAVRASCEIDYIARTLAIFRK